MTDWRTTNTGEMNVFVRLARRWFCFARFWYTAWTMSSEAPHGGHEKAGGHAEKSNSWLKQGREKITKAFKSLLQGGIVSLALTAVFFAATGVLVPHYMSGSFAVGFAVQDMLNGSGDHKKAAAPGGSHGEH